jgi:hypothetical protein
MAKDIPSRHATTKTGNNDFWRAKGACYGHRSTDIAANWIAL